jgi:hypothetical protein
VPSGRRGGRLGLLAFGLSTVGLLALGLTVLGPMGHRHAAKAGPLVISICSASPGGPSITVPIASRSGKPQL